MQKDELNKLAKYLEENIRASRTSGIPFIDLRENQQRIATAQNHVIFGRRGAGKTTLMSSLHRRNDIYVVFINLEDFKDIQFPNIVIHLLIKLNKELQTLIKNLKWHHKLNCDYWNIKRDLEKETSQLEQLLNQPTTQEHKIKETTDNTLGGSVKTTFVSSEAKTNHKTELLTTVESAKIETLKQDLTKYKNLISSVTKMLSKNSPAKIYLVLDDFYFINKEDQPNLLDYFHRMTKDNLFYLKIGSIKHRSKIYRRDHGFIGIELQHDALPIDLDYTLDKFEELKNFMRKLLEKSFEKANVRLNIDDIVSENGFTELCIASGGVPRDFLSLFVALANKYDGKKINKTRVREVAISNISNKKNTFNTDSGSDHQILEDLLTRLIEYSFDQKRTSGFLISKQELETNKNLQQGLRELVDLRFIHQIYENTSKARGTSGGRFEAYLIDIGLMRSPSPRNFKDIDLRNRDTIRGLPTFSWSENKKQKSVQNKKNRPTAVPHQDSKNKSLKQLGLSFE